MAEMPEIPGYFNRAQRAFYDERVAALPEGAVFVEVGCFLGKSTVHLARAIVRSQKAIDLHVVDHFRDKRFTGDQLAEFRKNLTAAEVADLVVIHCGSSHAVAETFRREWADVVYVDASHDYESVVGDIRMWLPVVKAGGLLAGDDYDPRDFPSVVRAVHELLPGFRRVSGTTWVYEVGR